MTPKSQEVPLPEPGLIYMGLTGNPEHAFSAAQMLAYATARTAALEASLKKANSQAEHFEREWYLRGDALEALEERVKWQPIETAPKGRTLLVGYLNRASRWRTVKATYYLPQTLELHEDHAFDDDSDGFAPEGWYEESETHELILPLEIDPTHWMLLPPAAIDTARGEGGERG